MTDDTDHDHPELRDYVPSEGKPLRHPMTLRVMRIVIVLGVFGLIAPTVYTTIGLQVHTANSVCSRIVTGSNVGAVPVARFELMGAVGPSWYCYARTFDGHEVLVRSLGLIPG
ncbi:MAG: hypothetical protein ABIR17_01735 [Pseudolysinimonas sp.]|uniref:hypothetical protein n=1 Tax=Pseudolysinimonas sp. TaxID=2680009 RepID=UPI0032674E99